MEKIFERILFMANGLQGNPAYQEYNDWLERWKQDKVSVKILMDTSETITKMDSLYPMPSIVSIENFLDYVLSEARARINTMILASTWIKAMLPGELQPLDLEGFEYLVDIAEEATNDKLSNA